MCIDCGAWGKETRHSDKNEDGSEARGNEKEMALKRGIFSLARLVPLNSPVTRLSFEPTVRIQGKRL